MKQIIILCILILCSSCSSTPKNAIPGRISVLANTDSPYWSSLINRYISRGINDYARYQIVDGSRNSPYQIVVTLFSANSYMSGFTNNKYGANMNYRTRLEVKAELKNRHGYVVYSWSGWADYNSSGQSMKKIAKMLGKSMKDAGFLEPSYY